MINITNTRSFCKKVGRKANNPENELNFAAKDNKMSHDQPI